MLLATTTREDRQPERVRVRETKKNNIFKLNRNSIKLVV